MDGQGNEGWGGGAVRGGRGVAFFGKWRGREGWSMLVMCLKVRVVELACIYTLEGKVCGGGAGGGPRRTWMDDMEDKTRVEAYERVKGAAEDGTR